MAFGRRVLSSALLLLVLLVLLLGAASAQQAAQLRGVQQQQQQQEDEFGEAVRGYYHVGRGIVVGDDDAWAPVVRESAG